MNAIVTPEIVAASNKAGIETLLSLACGTFASVERVANLQLHTLRSAMESGVAGTRALMTVKSAQELVELQADIAQPLVGNMLGYARSVHEIAARNQEDLSRVFDTQVGELNKTVSTALEQAARYAPAGAEAAFDSARSAVAAASSAYENMAKAAKHVAEIAEVNIAAATDAAGKAVNSAVEVTTDVSVKAVSTAVEVTSPRMPD